MSDNPTPSRPVQIAATALFVIVLVACIAVPWALQFLVAWWAAIPSWFVLAFIYERLFVPRDSLCWGMPFGFALSSFVALLLVNGVLLAKWVLRLF
jgi:hypothetical protein